MKTIKQLANENHRSYTRVMDVIQILNIPTQKKKLNKSKAMILIDEAGEKMLAEYFAKRPKIKKEPEVKKKFPPGLKESFIGDCVRTNWRFV